MTVIRAFCSSSSLLLRLASNSQACCSSSAVAIGAHDAFRPIRGLAGFVKVGKDDATKKKKFGGDGPDSDNPHLKPLITLLSSPERKPVPPTPEEQEAAAAYLSAREAEQQAWARDMKVKFQLQQEALRALPERLRALALQPDHTPFPMNRKFLFDTPPESYRDRGNAPSAEPGKK